MANETVLVTGGTGFVGAHCILQLLAAGYRVRTTVRSLSRKDDVLTMLRTGGSSIPESAPESIAFFAADLTSDAGWREAAAGCDYVLHVASPFPGAVPKDEDELIRPARDGALRVLRAAREAGVRRVVLTSSFAAIGYGHPEPKTLFDETDWTNPEGADVLPYIKSKTIAERAAWDWIAKEGGALELSTVNPVGIFGPVLGPDYSTSILLVQRLMTGAIPGCPKLTLGAVDVRDVADLHLRAMTNPAAKGERFLAVAGDFMSMREIALALRNRLGDAAKKVPTRELPNIVVRMVALFDPAAKQILPELGHRKNASNAKAKRILGWQPRSSEESLAATAESMIRLGLLK